MSHRGGDYFNGTLSDGKATIKLVGFREAQQAKTKELMEREQAVYWMIAKMSKKGKERVQYGAGT